MFRDKVIIVGVTGGIAAYKTADLVSRLSKRGAQVYCIMTRSAREFITPLTLQTLSRNPVYTDMFAEPRQWNVEHISLADRADLFMIVPASANIIGKISHGIADDFLSTTVMATRAPVLIAPAMNVNMYLNPITQENIKKLKELNYHFVEPGYGDLACGYQGQGRLAELENILAKAEELLNRDKPLKGKKVLITAGPTREALDPVRYITNRSSGKMGYALAKQAYLLGAETTLVSGPTNLQPFPGIKRINIESAREMHETVLKFYQEQDIVIKAAAVADYRPKQKAEQKIKKQPGEMVLELERNPDILAELGQNKGGRILIGFAAETNNVLAYAAEKAKRKNLDFIVANDLTQPGAGFGVDTNIISLVFPDGQIRNLPQMDKEDVAREILLVAAQYLNKTKE